MAVVTVFRSEHPDVLGWWAELQAGEDQFREKAKALQEQYPGHGVLVIGKGFAGRRVTGLGHHEDDSKKSPGELWRQEWRGSICYGWVPNRRTRAGKDLAAELAEIERPDLPMPGMTSTLIHDGHWYSPGAGLLDGAVWATWGCEYELITDSSWSKNSLDLNLWSRSKLSAYHLAREAADEAKVDA